MKRRGERLDERDEWQIWILCTSGASAFTQAVGLVRPSGITSEALGGPDFARAWATAIAVGCVVALVGIAWPRRPGQITVNGLSLEEVGSVLVGFSFLVYAAGAVRVTGPPAFFAALIIAALGILALKRSWNIARDLRKYRATRG